MARIYNKNVQDIGLEFLKTHYQKRFDQSAVFVQKNIKTKKGRKLSGLVACQQSDNGIFTASLEVRSLASIQKPFPFLSQLNWLWKTILAAFLLFGITTGVGYFFPQYFMHLLVPSVVVLVAWFLYGTLRGDKKSQSEASLVQRLKQTPANERWLLLTIDSDVMAFHAKLDILRHQCERKGIGILSVSKGRKIRIVQRPKAQHNFLNDYVSHYGPEQEIKQFFKAQKAYVPAAYPAGVTEPGLSPVPVLIKAS